MLVIPEVCYGNDSSSGHLIGGSVETKADESIQKRFDLAEREEVVITVSDLQLADGPDNPLEDFPYDQHFADFLALLLKTYPRVKVLRLRLLGDTFEPQAVKYKGRYFAPSTERVGVAKIKKIFQGHPVFIKALVYFLSFSHTLVDFLDGNHDLCLIWPKVQELIRDRLSQGDQLIAQRIQFISQTSAGQHDYRDVVYTHGHNAELSTKVHHGQEIITHHRGRKLKEPILNEPIGSYMSMLLVNQLKLRNRVVDRTRRERETWIYSALYRVGWGFQAGYFLISRFIYARFFAHWHCRKTCHFFKWLWIALKTLGKYRVDRHAYNLLKTLPDRIKALVCAHTHRARQRKFAYGIYFNTGTWSLTYAIVYRPGIPFWKKVLLLEKPILVPVKRFTFAQVDYYKNGRCRPGLMEFDSDHHRIIPFVDSDF
ncbi:hypothetical protein ACFLZY_01035 [Patescibacteria group bacterium]